MASKKEEEEEDYSSESDPAASRWAMRRRVASDDDDDDDDNDDAEEGKRRWFGSGCSDDSDSLGAAPEDEVEEEVEDDVSLIDDLEVLGKEEEEEREGLEGGEEKREEAIEEKEEDEEKQKEKELVEVPRYGAFYEHDDRRPIRRRRKTSGRKNSGKSNVGTRWEHDRFKELQEPETKGFTAFTKVGKTHERDSRVYYKDQGKGDTQSSSVGTVKGRGPVRYRPLNSDQGRGYNQIQSFRIGRGRGPTRYKPRFSCSNAYPPTTTANKNSEKAPGKVKTHNPNLARVVSHSSNSDAPGSEKHASASSHNYHWKMNAIPSNPDLSAMNKIHVQPRTRNGSFPTSLHPLDKTWAPHSNTNLQGETPADSIRNNKLHAGEPVHLVQDNLVTSLPSQSSINWSTCTAEFAKLWSQARNITLSSPVVHQSLASRSPVDRASQMPPRGVIGQGPVGRAVEPPVLVYRPQFSSHSGTKSPASFGTRYLNPSSLGVMGSSDRLSGLEFDWASERGSGSGPGSEPQAYENFTATTQLLPVMQFHDQDDADHPVDRALASYMAEPSVAFGNSWVTWLPVLSASSGVVSSASFPSESFGQMSSAAVASNEVEGRHNKASEHRDGAASEVVNNEPGLRRAKLMRYSKMNVNLFEVTSRDCE